MGECCLARSRPRFGCAPYRQLFVLSTGLSELRLRASFPFIFSSLRVFLEVSLSPEGPRLKGRPSTHLCSLWGRPATDGRVGVVRVCRMHLLYGGTRRGADFGR